VRHLPIITEQAPPTLTPAAARAAIESLCALEERVKVWWSWIDAWVDTVGPLDLGNGKVYRGWDEERESIVVDDAAELALQEHLGAAWRSAVEKSITKTNIASALKAVDPSKGQAARQRAVMASLRVAGCTRTKTIRKHGVK
jgi:hypothetical protein